MDWKVAATAFGALFLAELGDKTQLTALTLAASTRQPIAVFVGASAALVAVTLIGVLAGSAFGEVVPLGLIRKVAAVAFIVIGVTMLLGWL
jgi:putative Ca2+/H+ antiporter (TMEM165/GDT1 family)